MPLRLFPRATLRAPPPGRRGRTQVHRANAYRVAGDSGGVGNGSKGSGGGADAGDGVRGSKAAVAVCALQARLPAARVVYVSATGASEAAHLLFAARLGLWGPGTAFPRREAFVREIKAGGTAAMELVAVQDPPPPPVLGGHAASLTPY